MDDQRKAFEAYMRANKPLFPLDHSHNWPEKYSSPGTQHQWEGWQARDQQALSGGVERCCIGGPVRPACERCEILAERRYAAPPSPESGKAVNEFVREGPSNSSSGPFVFGKAPDRPPQEQAAGNSGVVPVPAFMMRELREKLEATKNRKGMLTGGAPTITIGADRAHRILMHLESLSAPPADREAVIEAATELCKSHDRLDAAKVQEERCHDLKGDLQMERQRQEQNVDDALYMLREAIRALGQRGVGRG